MGSAPEGFVKVSKAAEILGKPARAIHQYCKEGLVRRRMEGNRVYVKMEDIAEIHRLNIAGEMKPRELVKRVLLMEQKINRLEEAMNLVFKVNEIQASQFESMSDEDLYSLYENLLGEKGERAWTVDRLLACCEVYVKITESEIDRLNQLLQVDHSWKLFFELSLKQSKYVREHEDLNHDLELQRIRDLLAMGRKNLRTVAVLFIERAATMGPSQKLLQMMAASDVDAFDELAKQSAKRNNRGDHALL